MRASISGVVLDLMTFVGEGNFTHFNLLFTKACKYLNCEFDDNFRRTMRNYTFRFLQEAGYVDASSNRWAVAPGVLIEIRDGTFAVVANAQTIEVLRSQTRSELSVTPSREKIPNLPPGVTLYPPECRLNTSISKALELAESVCLNVEINHQKRIFSYLPTQASLLKKAAENCIDPPVFKPGSLQCYDFQDGKWCQYSEISLLEEGLYRKTNDYCFYDYYIALQGNFRNQIRIKETDWKLVLALSLLQKKLSVRYNQKLKQLSVSRKYNELALPILLERCLRSGEFRKPERSRDWLTYSGLTKNSLWKLISKLPVFELEIS